MSALGYPIGRSALKDKVLSDGVAPSHAAGTGSRMGRDGASSALVLAWLDKPGLVREHDGLYAGPHAELAQYSRHVSLDGGCAQEEPLADLGVGEAAAQQLQDLELALGQLGKTVAADRLNGWAADVA